MIRLTRLDSPSLLHASHLHEHSRLAASFAWAVAFDHPTQWPPPTVSRSILPQHRVGRPRPAPTLQPDQQLRRRPTRQHPHRWISSALALGGPRIERRLQGRRQGFRRRGCRVRVGLALHAGAERRLRGARTSRARVDAPCLLHLSSYGAAALGRRCYSGRPFTPHLLPPMPAVTARSLSAVYTVCATVRVHRWHATQRPRASCSACGGTSMAAALTRRRPSSGRCTLGAH